MKLLYTFLAIVPSLSKRVVNCSRPITWILTSLAATNAEAVLRGISGYEDLIGRLAESNLNETVTAANEKLSWMESRTNKWVLHKIRPKGRSL